MAMALVDPDGLIDPSGPASFVLVVVLDEVTEAVTAALLVPISGDIALCVLLDALVTLLVDILVCVSELPVAGIVLIEVVSLALVVVRGLVTLLLLVKTPLLLELVDGFVQVVVAALELVDT